MTINGAALWLGFISLHLLLLRVLCEDVAVNGTNESVTLLAGETQSELVRRMTRRISKSTLPLIVGIAGGSGSGKTTVAAAVLEELGGESAAIITHDSYYKDISHLSVEQRAEQNFDHPSE
jgi:pantothenate kinase-related protein Tda10